MAKEQKIVPIRHGIVVKGEPIDEIVDMLEKYLEEAKQGKINGLAVAISRPNDIVGTGFWFGEAGHKLTAAVGSLFYRLHSHVDDRCDD